MRILHLIWPLVLTCLSGTVLAQSGASYTAQRRIDTITVDGNLNEASWHSAADTSAFTFWDGASAPAALQTTAKMIWDDVYLYIAFVATDRDVYSTYTARDARLWEQDNFEVFVTVPGTNHLSAARGIQIQATGRAAITRDLSSGLSGDLTQWGMGCP